MTEVKSMGIITRILVRMLEVDKYKTGYENGYKEAIQDLKKSAKKRKILR